MDQLLRRLVIVVGLAAAFVVSATAFQDDRVYQVGDEGVTAPRATKEVRPRYTPEAMRAKIQGEVVMRTIVTQKGQPTEIRVIKSLEESLDREAVNALAKWVFEPGRRHGDPVCVELDITVTFKIF
jgi:TonB family protein